MSNELVAWLRRQLDADEYLFRHWPGDGTESVAAPDGVTVARWSPDLALAEVDAKRRILDVYQADVIDVSRGGGPPEWIHGAVPVEAHTVLRLLALPYADRTGYREEWKP